MNLERGGRRAFPSTPPPEGDPGWPFARGAEEERTAFLRSTGARNPSAAPPMDEAQGGDRPFPPTRQSLHPSTRKRWRCGTVSSATKPDPLYPSLLPAPAAAKAPPEHLRLRVIAGEDATSSFVINRETRRKTSNPGSQRGFRRGRQGLTPFGFVIQEGGCPHRLVWPRTQAFQACDKGSNPFGGTAGR